MSILLDSYSNSAYLPYKGIEDAITPRRLLNHHSGIPGDAESNGLFTYHHWNGYDSFLLGYLKDDYPAQYPGELAVYSNAAFDLAAILAARITRRNFADLAREVLFEPLGMRASAFGRVYENMAMGYDSDSAIIKPYAQGYGSDGASSNVNDLAQFLLMYLGRGTHPGGATVLKPATVTEVMTATETSPLDVYQTFLIPGLGWDNVTQPQLRYAGSALVKGGNDTGYVSQIAIMPDWNLGVVTLCNHSKIDSLPQAASIKCLQTAIEELGGPSPTDPALPDVSTETDLNSIAGFYANPSRPSVDSVTVYDERTLEWRQDILSAKPQSVMLVLDAERKAFVEQNSELYPNTKFYFKRMTMKDGDHFIFVTGKSPYMGISLERFVPATIPDEWRRRDGQRYLQTTFRHDGVAFGVVPQTLTARSAAGAEFLTLSGIPLVPSTSELAFVAGPLANRNDSTVRIQGAGSKGRLLFNGDSYRRLEGTEEAAVGVMTNFTLPSNELGWRTVVTSKAGEYYVNFPRGCRAIILDAELERTGQDSTTPWVWDCPAAGTYYVGLVAARPTCAFLELAEPWQARVAVSASSGGSAVADATLVSVGKETAVSAAPEAGNLFLWWEVVAGDADIKERFNSRTTVTVRSNATVMAVFALESETAALTLRNDGIGECDPIGAVRVKKDQPFTIKATPDDGFAFVRWEIVSGAAHVGNEYAQVTTVTTSEDAALQAVFRGNPIVAAAAAKVMMNAAGNGALLCKGSLRGLPLSAEVLDTYASGKLKGVSCGGAYVVIDGDPKGAGVAVDAKKGVWSFSFADLPAVSGDWNGGQLDLVLRADDGGVSCWNPHWNTVCQWGFEFDSKKQTQTAVAITGTAMKNFSIGKMSLNATAGKAGGDRLLISGSVFELPTQTLPENESILVTIGRITLRLPPISHGGGNWKSSSGVHTYASGAFYGGKVKAVFDMPVKIWSLRLDKASLAAADFSDCPVIRLSIGEYEAASRLDARRKLSLK